MLRRIAQLGHFLASIALVGITLMVTIEVILRSFFNHSFLFVDEVSGYLLVALTFFGATHALETGGMLRVDFIYERLRKRTQESLDIFYDFLGFVLTSGLTYYFARMARNSYESGITSSGSTDMPLYIPQLTMVLGMALMAATLLIRTCTRTRRLRDKRPT